MSSRRYEPNDTAFHDLNASLLYISTSKYGADWQSIPHIHYFSELNYITKGCGSVIADGQEYPVKKDDLVILPPGLEHTERSSASAPLEYISIGIGGVAILGGAGKPGSSAESAGLGGSLCILPRQEESRELLPLILLLLREAEEEREGSAAACQALLKVLLIRIFRSFKLAPSPLSGSKTTRECSLIKRYIDANYAEPITLETLAALAHMSKYYLVHAFTRYSGLSPIAYLNARRIEVSRGLLLTTDHSAAQIASLVGFSSQSYFSQVFKRHQGMSPAQFRREHSEEAARG